MVPPVPPPTSMQAARELAGSVWVPSWAGSVRVTRWRYISSGCSAVSHTTFHDSPRHRSTLDGRALGAEAPGTSIYTSRGTQLSRPLPRAFEPSRDSTPSRARLPANRTILHASQGAWGRPGPPWGPRTAAPAPLRRAAAQPLLPDFLPDFLPSAAPPICPSFAANWRMLRAYWDRLPGPQSPSPLARGGPPRGQASPQSPTPHDEIDSLGSPRLPPAPHRATRPAGARAHAESPAVKRLPSRPTTATSLHHHPLGK
jgi:hypothetical protein